MATSPTRERIQSQHDRARFDDTTKCILCACCTTSCPVYWSDGSYFGPAAIVNAHRFIFDSRDEAASERLDILNDKDGVWRCRTNVQLHRRVPPRHPGDKGYSGSQASTALRSIVRPSALCAVRESPDSLAAHSYVGGMLNGVTT